MIMEQSENHIDCAEQESVAATDDVFDFTIEDNICPECGSYKSFRYQALADKTGRLLVKRICTKCTFFEFLKKDNKATHGGRDNKSQYVWQEKVKKRDDFKCVICGTKINIHAHHIIPVSNDKKRQYAKDINNGITLCEFHHAMIHGNWMRTQKDNQVQQAIVNDIVIEAIRDFTTTERPALKSMFKTSTINVDFCVADGIVDVTMLWSKKNLMLKYIAERSREELTDFVTKRISDNYGGIYYVSIDMESIPDFNSDD